MSKKECGKVARPHNQSLTIFQMRGYTLKKGFWPIARIGIIIYLVSFMAAPKSVVAK
jgi:hypothetical protein